MPGLVRDLGVCLPLETARSRILMHVDRDAVRRVRGLVRSFRGFPKFGVSCDLYICGC